MTRSIRIALAVAALAPLAGAQQSLTFTTFKNERTLSGSSGTILTSITPEDVAIVTPSSTLPSAEKFLSHMNRNTLAGDGNLDANHYASPLAMKVDALQICPPATGLPHTARELYISTRVAMPCAGGGVIDPGDVHGVAIGATMTPMIDDMQIRNALGITPNTPTFNVDAFTRDAAGAIYLSFEQDVPILLGTQMLLDGGVAMIPASALTWTGCAVTGVVPNSGLIAFNENFANLMVVNASVSDNTGNFVQVIFDLDGLEIDPNGGTFPIPGTTLSAPNLLFSGEYLTGGGILSTAGGGSIAVINGAPMATPFGSGPTDGSQVGLFPFNVGSLNGLALSSPTCRFITDTSTPVLTTPGPINFTAGGADPGAPVFFYARIFGASGPGSIQPSIAVPNPCFPEWFLFNTFLFSLPADGLGIASVTAFYSGGVPAGATVVLQAVTPKTGGLSLSAPLTYQF